MPYDERAADGAQVSDTAATGPPRKCALRLSGERDTEAVTLDAYTYEQLRGCCEYFRGLMDFGVGSGATPWGLGGGGDTADTSEEPESHGRVLSVHTATWPHRVKPAARLVARLASPSLLTMTLLALADVWCVPAVKERVLAALCKGPCAGFRRPAANSAAVEGVPQVAALAAQALAYGIGDPDGGLGRLYSECMAWMAAWPARVWPSRTFAALARSIQEDVLAAAKARAAQPDAAPAALAACRALAAALPPVAWAARPREMCGELTTHTLAALWAKFPEVCASAGARQDRAECWPQLLEELRAHVAEHPEPDPALRARLQRQQQQGRASPTAWDAELQEEEEESWLGEEEARHMEALHTHVHSWVVRHMPLAVRCDTFRRLPQPVQRRIRELAVAGLAGPDAAASAAGASSSSGRSPGPNLSTVGHSAANAGAAATPPGSSGLRRGAWAGGEAEEAVGAGGSRAGAGGGIAMWTISLEPDPVTPGPKGSARKAARPLTAEPRASASSASVTPGRAASAAAVRGRAGTASGAGSVPPGPGAAAGPGPSSAAGAAGAARMPTLRAQPQSALRRQPAAAAAAASPVAPATAARRGDFAGTASDDSSECCSSEAGIHRYCCSRSQPFAGCLCQRSVAAAAALPAAATSSRLAAAGGGDQSARADTATGNGERSKISTVYNQACFPTYYAVVRTTYCATLQRLTLLPKK
eukprot:XP_001695479.1 predicted protein [Chlamydomonas reinhardtii]